MSTIQETLDERFGGLLRHGVHGPDSEVCAIELVTAWHGLPWGDDASRAGIPDLRPLNDAPWASDQARTQALMPVLEAFLDWGEWSEDRHCCCMEAIILRTIREVLPIALRASGLLAEANACNAATLKQAEAALASVAAVIVGAFQI